MKKSLTILLFTLSVTCLFAQNAPIDFETGGFGADWTWTVFENDSNPPLEIIANPDPSGANTSATVAQFTALQTGQPFAGCETMHGADIGTYTLTPETSMITISVWKNVISDVGIKLVEVNNASLGEIKIANTVTGQWEEITFDFSTMEGIEYDQIVIFPDFQARNADNIVYFDNIIFGELGPISTTELQNDQRLDLFPNPVQESLSLISDHQIDEVSVYNLLGELVVFEENQSSNISVDVSALANGVYFVKALINDKLTVREFVKQ